MTPSDEVRQENRVKTLLSQEANMRPGLEQKHRARKAENSTGVNTEKSLVSCFCTASLGLGIHQDGLPCQLWGMTEKLGCSCRFLLCI